MRPLFVVTGLEAGGAEHMLLRLLISSNHLRSGAVVSLSNGGSLLPRYQSIGIPVVCLNMNTLLGRVTGLFRLMSIILVRRPTVISTWMYHADLVGGIAGKSLGIPVVWGVRNSEVSRQALKWSTFIVMKTCAYFSRFLPTLVIAPSEAAVENHVQVGYQRSKFIVVDNGFDLAKFKPSDELRSRVRERVLEKDDVALVGFVGRNDPIKNIDGFLSIAVELALSRKDLHFLLVGEGINWDNKSIVGRIEGAGLRNRFSLLGLISNVHEVMPSLDVLVLTSRNESFPNVLGEAMACGVPCVAYGVGDVGRIIGPEGIVVEPGNEKAMIDGIRSVLNMPLEKRQQLSVRVRERIRGKFDIQDVVGKFERAFADPCGIQRQ